MQIKLAANERVRGKQAEREGVTTLRNRDIADQEIAESLVVVVAQRLVRRLCQKCRREMSLLESDRKWFEAIEVQPPAKVWVPAGCKHCNQIGYFGRVGVFELWRLDETDYRAILAHKDEHSLRAALARRREQSILGDAVKLTITPSAKKVLDDERKAPCSWPQLGNQGLFYTFAALDHDKVGEHRPPYTGVWLQRDDDLILEIPMSSDEDRLEVCPGHAYFLRGGVIQRQPMKNSCACGQPETHDERVSSALRLSTLVSRGKLILLPHPRCSALGLVFGFNWR